MQANERKKFNDTMMMIILVSGDLRKEPVR